MYLTERFLLIPSQSVVAYFPSNLGFDLHSRVHATAGGDVTVVAGCHRVQCLWLCCSLACTIQ